MQIFNSKKMKTTEQTPEENIEKREAGIWADSELNVHAEKRAHKRIPADLQARLFYGNLIYTGKVTNLSEHGMFISTKVKFPVNSVFMMVVLVDEHVLKIPIKVRRSVNPESDYRPDCGMGVELVNAPQNYLDYVSICKSSA